MSNIPLTKDGGLDPRQTYCRRCGGECSEIIIGDNRLLRNERLNQVALAPRGKVAKVAKELGWERHEYTVEAVPPGRLPATDFCDTCKKELDEFEAVVAAGGVFWRCAECHRTGVIEAGDFATAVRKANEVGDTEPCGVEFPECEKHGPLPQDD